MASNKGRRGQRWRKLVAQVKAEETHCWLCGQYVDPRYTYPDSRCASVDHVIEVDKAPHLMYERSNTRLACFGCNSSRGATYGNHKRNNKTPPPTHSRDW